MNLKKIKPEVAQWLNDLGVTTATELQEETWSLIKSGVTTAVLAPKGSGKTTALAMHVAQKLDGAHEQSPRALVLLPDNPAVDAFVLNTTSLFTSLDLKLYPVYDKRDIDVEKNEISEGIDILVAPVNKAALIFAGAGFNANRLKIIAIDQLEDMVATRNETKLLRILDSIFVGQRLIFAEKYNEKIEMVIDRVCEEGEIFDYLD